MRQSDLYPLSKLVASMTLALHGSSHSLATPVLMQHVGLGGLQRVLDRYDAVVGHRGGVGALHTPVSQLSHALHTPSKVACLVISNPGKVLVKPCRDVAAHMAVRPGLKGACQG